MRTVQLNGGTTDDRLSVAAKFLIRVFSHIVLSGKRKKRREENLTENLAIGECINLCSTRSLGRSVQLFFFFLVVVRLLLTTPMAVI